MHAFASRTYDDAIQLNLSSLMPLSAAGWGRLQLGACQLGNLVDIWLQKLRLKILNFGAPGNSRGYVLYIKSESVRTFHHIYHIPNIAPTELMCLVLFCSASPYAMKFLFIPTTPITSDLYRWLHDWLQVHAARFDCLGQCLCSSKNIKVTYWAFPISVCNV